MFDPTKVTDWYEKAGFPDGVSSLSEFMHVIEKWPPSENSWLFRGEAQRYENDLGICTNLMPTIARSGRLKLVPGTEMTRDELDSIEACQLTGYALSDPYLRADSPTQRMEDPDWVAIADHYGYATRLLGVTRRLLVSLHFATAEPYDQDGFVFLFFSGSLRPQGLEATRIAPNGDGIPIPASYRQLFDGAPETGGSRRAHLYRPLRDNARAISQSSVYFWWSGIANGTRCPSNPMPIRIRGQAKRAIRARLSQFGITDRALLVG